MPRPRRQTNIQLLNGAFNNIVKITSNHTPAKDSSMDGMGASRVVNPKKKVDSKKKKDDQPISTRILLTR